jgi:hypothetical protein
LLLWWQWWWWWWWCEKLGKIFLAGTCSQAESGDDGDGDGGDAAGKIPGGAVASEPASEAAPREKQPSGRSSPTASESSPSWGESALRGTAASESALRGTAASEAALWVAAIGSDVSR